MRTEYLPREECRGGRGTARGAYSLLEVVLASAICATALVPALGVMRDGLKLQRNIDTRQMLLTYAISKMEEQAAIVAGSWTDGTTMGTFAADGHADVRYVVTRYDNAGAGGIPHRLMFVQVMTFSDDDGDSARDSDEAAVFLRTKISKLVSYETMAGT